MARYTGSVCRLCRREGKKLFLKGERCYGPKCALSRRAYAPGQHGQGRKKVSEYGLQLRAKQQAKRYYFELASKQSGQAGENLLRILESRLDNVVYRSGLASSRKEARQLVRHGHYTLNGHKANIPSILLKAGDVVAVADKSRQNEKLKAVIEANSAHPVPTWMSFDPEKMTVVINQLPNREDIDLDVEEHLIVELYSK